MSFFIVRARGRGPWTLRFDTSDGDVEVAVRDPDDPPDDEPYPPPGVT